MEVSYKELCVFITSLFIPSSVKIAWVGYVNAINSIHKHLHFIRFSGYFLLLFQLKRVLPMEDLLHAPKTILEDFHGSSLVMSVE